MGYLSLLLLIFLSWNFFILGTHQLQSSQTQVLLQLRKQLEYPVQLEIWKDHTLDFCYLSSSTQVNITCQDSFVTGIKIMGDKTVKDSNFDGFAIPTVTLSGAFSMDSFVTTLARLTSLRVLSLVSLGIWGPLPDKIHRLSSLEYLDLSSNFLFGSVPPKICTMVKLQALSLDGNYFNGTVPDCLDSLSNLTVLSLGNNRLNGTPPEALFSLPNISYLNLASNTLSGSLSNHIHCSSELSFVDISNNKLTGGLPSCLSTALDKRVVNSDGNCLSIGFQHQHPDSYCMAVPVKKKESRSKDMGILVAVIGGVFVATLLLVFGCFFVCKRCCSRSISEQHLLHKTVQENSTTGLSSELLTNARFIPQVAKLGTEGVPVCRVFSLEELREATNNFDRSTFMGDGSNGKLYKGRLENGTQVAIRCLPLSKKYTIRNLKLRLDLIARLRHTHLVCLLGHGIDTGGRDDSSVYKVFLIYEYLPNGNFRSHLSENGPEKALKWSERLSVLIGVAKALHFLHTGVIPGFFNNRLKTNNILLNEHGMAKLSDYGLSIISEENDKHGEKGDGLKSWQMTKLEDDVYSFGLILLESLVGPSVSARREAFLQNEMASFGSQDGRRRIVDPTVLATCSQESLSIAISITNKCISLDSSTRPSAEDILWNLQYAAQIQTTADGDQRTDTAPYH
ncbi:unnamed protein product, partial [Vitis vinifera]